MKTIDLASSLRPIISHLYKGLRKNTPSAAGHSLTAIETVGHIARHQQILPTELAALTHITLQSMSQMLTQMEKEGIIKKTPAEDDKRKVYISLSAAGKDLVDRTRYEKNEWLKSTIDDNLNEKEKEILARAIPVLNKLVNK